MIPLHVRSHYSLLRGASSPEALVARARALGLPALALTDVDGIYGATVFWQAATAAGLTPLIGAEVNGLTLVTRSRKGWSNLCALLSRKHLGSMFKVQGDPESDVQGQDSGPGTLDHLGRWTQDFTLFEDLHVIASDLAVARSLRGKVDRLWLEFVRPGRSAATERDVLESGLPLVASSDVHFATPGEFRTHRVLSAIRENTVLPRLGPTCDPGHHLRDLRALFADRPDALANNDAVASDAAWGFLPAPPVFPRHGAPAGTLRALCKAGLARRYGTPTVEARARLDRELAVIRALGFEDYFLVVRDIVDYARSRGAPVAGRGSGASSLVAYVLGLTNVCPLRYGLQFERFLHEGRTDWPDLDLDFCWRTRDDVIDHVFERFGRERVAMVSSHLTLQARGAFREAAKAHGLSDAQVAAVRSALPVDREETVEALPSRFRSRLPVEPARFDEILADARRILGAPSHLSVHPGGVVITPGPVDRHVAVQRAEKGVVITQPDKDGVEALGLVKIDLLGNRAVSTIREAVTVVASLDGYRLDPEAVPDGDPATLDLLASGRTIGVNQLESPAVRHLLRQMRPQGLADVMQALALIRPGAAGDGMKDAFVRRRRGLEEWSVDPRLRETLGPTHGVMLYEDDLMLVASALSGMTLAEGDRFRRRLQKASPEEREEIGRDFLARCAADGTPPDTARDLWRQMAKFQGYAFCMSHAASYAQLAVATAWLRAHHPEAFWVAALNNNQGMYEKRVYVEEARRGGVATRLPCVNASGREFTAEGGGLRIGLDSVAGLSAGTIESILAERPFGSLREFKERAGAAHPEARALIRCGAFDGLGRPRPELLLELNATRRPAKPGSLRIPRMPDLDEREKRRWEFEVLGMSPGMHLMEFLRAGRDLKGTVASPELERLAGRRVRVAGVLDALRVTGSASGGAMEFLTLEDEAGVFEVTVFPDVYRRFAASVRGPGPYVVTGRVEDHWGAVSVTAERIEHVRAARPAPELAPEV
jgi:DNA polymerase-3 subunit alpha/error-prone DNA polymerase